MKTDKAIQLNQTWELAKWRNEDWLPDDYYDAPWKSESNPIIIGGCPRSGSTILRLLLGSHQEIVDGPETHLFLPLPIDIERLEKRFHMTPNSLNEIYKLATCRGEFIDGFQKLLLAQSGCSRWLEKTSRNVHAFGWIQKRFPFAKLLHILRDPRDVVVSLRTHPQYLRGKDERIKSNWYHPWKDCVDRWKRCVKDGISFRGDVGYLEVKYEKLVENPTKVLKTICNHIGIKFNSSMLSIQARKSRISGVQRAFVINNLEAGNLITKRRVGRWHRELPLDVQSYLESELNELMLSTDYL